ncbi:MAG: hypothetical protein P1U56_21710 [Saprospiraceae bacterium]|nr:hypothetical protein [Saprospiraceae bacterium]
MRILLITVLIIQFSISGIAQVTFTKEDVLDIGCTVIYQYLDSTYLETLELNQEGGPIEWDFTDVVDGIFIDTQTIISPSMSDYPDSFPLADLAQEYVENQTNFFDCRDTGVYLIGFGNGDELYHFDSTGLLQYSFPFTYEDIHDYEKSYTIGDNDYYVNYHTVGEAWGTITTPFGMFDCLKITSEEIREVTAPFVTTVETSTRVTYWSPAVGDVLFYLDVLYSAAGIEFSYKTGAYLIDINKNVPSSIDPLEFSKIKLYPNPTSNYIQIAIENTAIDDLQFVIRDQNGKLFMNDSFKNYPLHQDGIQIPIHSLSTGNYSIMIKENASIIGRSNFIVLKP